jgi:hypothetical protein
MKSVRCLLMGSAAGLMAVSAAQAADLPVKAAPVEYVKVCSLYGAGFWYVPGTDTCMKIGAWLRVEATMNEGDGGIPLGMGGTQTAAGRWTRTDTSALGFRYRALVTFDVRTQTEYGTLRSYMDVGSQATSTGLWPNAPVTPGAATTGEAALNSQYNNNNIDATRAFIQFAGFTMGRMRSFFDINSVGAYTLSNTRILADSSATGIWGVGYTAQFGGGISLSFSLEDGGMLAGSRGRVTTDISQFAFGNAALGSGTSLDNAGNQFFDPVMGLRIDQSWGYASVTGAFHNDSGGYYNNALNSTNTNLANTIVQGHPGDVWGYAGSAGFLLTDFMGLKGDTFMAQANYGKGASGYVVKGTGTWASRSGNNIGSGSIIDGIFADNTSVDLSTAYAVAAAYEHFWTPKLHTAVQGGFDAVRYTDNQKNLICSGAPGFAVINNSKGSAAASTVGQPAAFVNGWAPGSVCNPSFSFWQLGTRTIWNPHPDLDIGVEIMYTGLNTANKGATVNVGAASGAVPPGLYTFANEGIWTGVFRVQRNFIP